jgi:hypothetical protein
MCYSNTFAAQDQCLENLEKELRVGIFMLKSMALVLGSGYALK